MKKMCYREWYFDMKDRADIDNWVILDAYAFLLEYTNLAPYIIMDNLRGGFKHSNIRTFEQFAIV